MYRLVFKLIISKNIKAYRSLLKFLFGLSTYSLTHRIKPVLYKARCSMADVFQQRFLESQNKKDPFQRMADATQRNSDVCLKNRRV